MQSIAFHGGTALRFLFSIPRYSEDLDFALERLPDAYDFRTYLHQINRDFLAESYTLDFKVSDKGAVHKAFVRFRGLPYELGLSGHESEVLAVKLGVDTNPPKGAVVTTTALHRHISLNLQHHDRASLLAGKLHAVLQRTYPKGRDFYDLWWYLSQPDWPTPNLILLNAALAQTGWDGPTLNSVNWRSFIQQRVKQLTWQEDVLQDMRAFIMTDDWEEKFTRTSLIGLLAS